MMMMTTFVSSALQCIIMITVMMIVLICRCPQCTAEQAGYLVSTDPAAGPEAKVDWLTSNFIIIVVWPRWSNFSSLPKTIVMILATISSLIFSIGLALFASGSRRALSWTPSPRFSMIMIRI